MGGYCGCLKESAEKTELNATIEFSRTNKLTDELKRNEKKIIKIQALIRGFIYRKRFVFIINEYYKTKVNEQLSAYSSSILNFNTRISSSFYYGHDDEDEPYNNLKEFRGTVILENGAKYFGEW